MKDNMAQSRVKRSPRNRMIVFAIIFLLLSMAGINTVPAQKGPDEQIKKAVQDFFEAWLVRRDVDEALKFISDRPVFPSCIVDKGDGGPWGTSKGGVVEVLRSGMSEDIYDTRFTKTFEFLIRPKGVLYSKKKGRPDFRRVDIGQHSSEYDIYPVGKELRDQIVAYKCNSPSDTKNFTSRVKRAKDLHLVVANSRTSDAGMSFLWAREPTGFRIISIDARIP